jgi:hypothetical protein
MLAIIDLTIDVENVMSIVLVNLVLSSPFV